MRAISQVLDAHAATTADSLTLLVLHRRPDAPTAWRELTGKLAQFCRLVRVELSETTIGTDTAPAPAAPAGMVTALSGLVTMLAAHSDGIHVVSDSYGSPLAQRLAQLHPQSLRSMSLLDTPQSGDGAALGLRSVSAPPHSPRIDTDTDADADADGCASPFLAILRRYFVVEHRRLQRQPTLQPAPLQPTLHPTAGNPGLR